MGFLLRQLSEKYLIKTSDRYIKKSIKKERIMKKMIFILTLTALPVISYADCTAGSFSLTGGTNTGNDYNNYVSLMTQKVITHIQPNMILEAIATSSFKAIAGSNIIAYEYIINKPSGLNEKESTATITTNASSSGEGIVISSLNNIEGDQLAIIPSSNLIPKTRINENPAVNSNRIGFYINTQSKSIGYIINGVNKGYKWTYTQPLSDVLFYMGVSFGDFQSNSSKVGLTVSQELVTDHSKLQFMYPSGTTDICGNII